MASANEMHQCLLKCSFKQCSSSLQKAKGSHSLGQNNEKTASVDNTAFSGKEKYK